ncbi:hypothetical protein G443_003503 [Actinoalloteichus cyanogriseus DSM 43889]|uniref:Uncharacterized protein n=1 Tax=Actinoalloteichus caeruleus DSM 43889 TaxID=1120930 RepID=A0ABT1JL42_ACTCY|nr:hypothetical protein [Actinoalloteichus caeruleus DSM 43889]
MTRWPRSPTGGETTRDGRGRERGWAAEPDAVDAAGTNVPGPLNLLTGAAADRRPQGWCRW